ncbi:unnamed protein product [Rotaria sp. Silwood2]|nr:unnamed protein product [Rotaria sp. Silwood2]
MSAIFTESTHGKRQLCYLGYRYSLKRKNQNGSEYWICVKCQTTATSYLDLSVIVREDHIHLPDETDKEVLEMRQNLKRKAIEESTPIDRIVEEAFHAINSQSQSNDFLTNMPSIATIKNTLQKQRRKTHPPFQHQSNNCHIHYPKLIAKQNKANHFYYMMGHWLPIRLRTTTIDFKLAVNNVFTKNYPTVIVRGCLFHYGQSGLQCLIHTRPVYPGIEEFLNYFHNTYGPLSKFLPHMCNHYRNILPRTTNYLEGRHSRLKKHVNAPHPNIYVAIGLLQKKQSLASISRLRDNMGAPSPKRRKNKVIIDECLIKLWQRYDEGRLDIPSFLKAAGPRYFQRPPKS